MFLNNMDKKGKRENMFKFDKTNIPNVELLRDWKLTNGETNTLYQAGDWSFETEDWDEEYAEKAVYAWIAWLNFIKENKETNTRSNDND
jgi:hypothetical protein